jgi:hypothetical protein
LVIVHDIFNDFAVAYDSGVAYITNTLYEALNIMCGVFSFEASMELCLREIRMKAMEKKKKNIG